MTVPQSMYWQRWYDIEEIQMIVNNMTNTTIKDMFTKEPANEKTFAVLYEKYGEYALFARTLNQTMQWKCAQENKNFMSNLTDLYDTFVSRLRQMNRYGELELTNLQAKFDNNDYSWYLTVNGSRAIFDVLEKMQDNACNSSSPNVDYYTKLTNNMTICGHGQNISVNGSWSDIESV